MLTPCIGLSLVMAGLLTSTPGIAAQALNYPAKPIRIVASEAGGGGDLMARLIANLMAGPMGQPVVLDNRPSSLIADVVAKAPADGYTLLIAGNSTWIATLLQTTSYDPVRDLAPVTMATRAPNILVVHPSLRVHSVGQLIALAKARPGELNYASGATGGAPHIAGELFKAMAGVNIVSVPFKGASPSLNALLGGHVELTFATAASVSSHVKSGRLRALAVTGSQRSPTLPALPAVAETVPGYESVGVFGVWVPGRTPETIIARLNAEITHALKRPETVEKLFSVGAETVGSTAEAFGDMIKADLTRIRKLIADTGIRASSGN